MSKWKKNRKNWSPDCVTSDNDDHNVDADSRECYFSSPKRFLQTKKTWNKPVFIGSELKTHETGAFSWPLSIFLYSVIFSPVLCAFGVLWRRQQPPGWSRGSSGVPRFVGSPGIEHHSHLLGILNREQCCLPECWAQPKKRWGGQCSRLCSSKEHRCSGTSSSPFVNVSSFLLSCTKMTLLCFYSPHPQLIGHKFQLAPLGTSGPRQDVVEVWNVNW